VERESPVEAAPGVVLGGRKGEQGSIGGPSAFGREEGGREKGSLGGGKKGLYFRRLLFQGGRDLAKQGIEENSLL